MTLTPDKKFSDLIDKEQHDLVFLLMQIAVPYECNNPQAAVIAAFSLPDSVVQDCLTVVNNAVKYGLNTTKP